MNKSNVREILDYLAGTCADVTKRRIADRMRNDPKFARRVEHLRASIVSAIEENPQAMAIVRRAHGAGGSGGGGPRGGSRRPVIAAGPKAIYYDSAPPESGWTIPLFPSESGQFGLAARTDEAEPRDELPVIDLDRKAKCVLLRHRAKDVPFAVVRLELFDRNANRVLGTRVVSMARRSRAGGDVRLAVVDVADWVDRMKRPAAPDAAGVCLRVISATDAPPSLREFAEFRGEIEAASKKEQVRHDPELRTALLALLKLLGKTTA